jgi:Flp pilus assembly protein TadG
MRTITQEQSHGLRSRVVQGCRQIGLRSRLAGQSVVEFALIAPPLLILLVVGADFARAFATASNLTSAARAGVEYGAQNSTTAADSSGMQTAAVNDSNGLLSTANVTASKFCECGGAVATCGASCASTAQTFVKVNTSATFQTLAPYPGIPRSLPLQGNATMLVP